MNMIRKALMLLVLSVTSTQAVEILVTDMSGNSLNTTTNKLDLGNSPTPKTVKLWMTYSSAEATTANTAGGLFSGGVIITPANSSIATIIPPQSSAFTNPNNQWESISSIFNGSTNVGVSFTQGTSKTGLTLNSSGGQILLLEVLISPGPSMSPTGTNFSFTANPSYAVFSYGTQTNIQGFNPQPTSFVFTVVPEPTTYALGAVATAMLGGVGFYRRKKAVKSL
jgi:hypothetical protein